jgi:hypothetical protein
MQIPDRVPGLKWLVIFWAVTAVVWSVLEGDFGRVRFFAFLTTLTGLGYLFQRLMAGKAFSVVGGLLTMALWGLALGMGTALITFFLMILKTGLHAHGPEFSMVEIMAVWGQIPLWSLVGVLIGLGLGFLLIAKTGKP